MAKYSAQEARTKKAYNARPENKKKRVIYNRNRRKALREGRVKKHDGTEIHHKTPLAKGGKDTPSNRKVVTKSENAGWRGKHKGMHPHDTSNRKTSKRRKTRRVKRKG